MALRLSRFIGDAPEFSAQRAVELWDASRVLKANVQRIKPLSVAKRIPLGGVVLLLAGERFLDSR